MTNLNEQFEIGDILCNSWGWGYVDFYKVTGRVGKSSLKIIKISSFVMKNDDVSNYVTPNAEMTQDEEFTARINKRNLVCIPGENMSMDKWDNKPVYINLCHC